MAVTRRAVLILAAALTLAAPAPALADGRYVAIGDSLASPSDSYVQRLAQREGLTDVHVLASGSTAVEVATGGQLAEAVRLIDDRTDTVLVTVGIGGNDFLRGNCTVDWNRPTCDFADGMHAILSGLRRALDGDPGDERLLVLGYYNPSVGAGDERERQADTGLRGTDGVLDSAAHGDAWGMTDVTGWLACRDGATLADAWPAFEAGGPALIGPDRIHPTDAGQEALTNLFADPASGGATPPCPPTVAFATTLPDAGDGLAHGIVEPRLDRGRWWFEYGPTEAYGGSTEPVAFDPAARAQAAAAAFADRPGTYHVRLVTENAVGRSTGEDQLVVAGPPSLRARLKDRQTRASVLRRGLVVHVTSNAATVRVRVVLRRRGPDTVAADLVTAPAHGLEVPLQRGRRYLAAAARARLSVTVTARRGAFRALPVKLALTVR